MSAQVVWIHQPYQPSHEELKRLEQMQDYITGARAGMENRIKMMHPFMQMVERGRFHAYFRDKLHLVPKVQSNN